MIDALPRSVCVVTAFGPDGPAGMTASSVGPLSLDPPVLVVGIRAASRTLHALRSAGRFAVNVLAGDQADLATRFASRRAGTEKYGHVPHRLEAGAPVIDAAPAWAVLDLRAAHPEGDHTFGVGAVRATGGGPGSRPPLITHGGRLYQLEGLPSW